MGAGASLMDLPEKYNQYVIDLETDGLLKELTKIHCLSVVGPNGQAELVVGSHECRRFFENLSRAPGPLVLVGHNICGFDIVAACKVYPVEMRRLLERNDLYVFDTAILSRLFWSDLFKDDLKAREGNSWFKMPGQMNGNHTLESWGWRLGQHKGDYSGGWDTYSQEMGDYCLQDSVVCKALWDLIQAQFDIRARCVELEHNFAECCEQQMHRGVCFDVDAAKKLASMLQEERAAIDLKYAECHFMVEYETPKLKIKKTKRVTFNPGSRDHVAKMLREKHGWQPQEFTPGGKPMVNETILKKLPWEEAKDFAQRFTIQKRLGMLSEGKHSWLNHVTKEGRIHGRIIHNGTPTARCTHSSPNLGQCPSTRSPYGTACRSLFTVPAGHRLVGADAKGLELRCLGHNLAEFDGGAYSRTVVEQDPHMLTLEAGKGLIKDRDTAKTVIYGLIYGAGDEKLGAIVGGTLGDGRKLRRALLEGIPGLKQLIRKVKKQAERGYLDGLDGRRIPVRSAHSALNAKLQSDGAIVMKQAVVNFNHAIAFRKGVHQVLMVHDEMQVEVNVSEIDPEDVADMACEAITYAGEAFDMLCPMAGDSNIGINWAETH